MIYTLCLSPAIDYNMYLENLLVDKINKSKIESFHAGGKGINVSLILKELGQESVCLGFLGGFTGKYILDYLNEMNVKNDFVWTNRDTRINVKIKTNSGETAIDGTGPVIEKHYIDALKEKIFKLHKGDILVLSGNTCAGVPETIYEEILEKLDKDVLVVVDSVRYLLMSSLKYKPFFIKPNKEELEEALKIKIQNEEQLIQAMQKMQDLGAQNVIVTLGSEGAILLDNQSNITKIKVENDAEEVVNTIGCGDSVVAGTIYQFLQKGSLIEGLKMGVACGNACCHVDHFASKDKIMDYYKSIK